MIEKDYEYLTRCRSSLSDAIAWISSIEAENVENPLSDALIKMQIAYAEVQYAINLNELNFFE